MVEFNYSKTKLNFFFSLKPAIVVTLAWYVNVLSVGDFFKQRWIIFSLFFSWLCFVYFLYLSFNFFLFFKKGTGFVEKSQSMFSIFHILIFQKFWFFFLWYYFSFFQMLSLDAKSFIMFFVEQKKLFIIFQVFVCWGRPPLKRWYSSNKSCLRYGRVGHFFHFTF